MTEALPKQDKLGRIAYVYKLAVSPAGRDDPDGDLTDMEAINNFSHAMSSALGLAEVYGSFSGVVEIHHGENLCEENELLILASPEDYKEYKSREDDMLTGKKTMGRVTILDVTECEISDEVLRINGPGEKRVISTAQKPSQPQYKTDPKLEKILNARRSGDSLNI